MVEHTSGFIPGGCMATISLFLSDVFQWINIRRMEKRIFTHGENAQMIKLATWLLTTHQLQQVRLLTRCVFWTKMNSEYGLWCLCVEIKGRKHLSIELILPPLLLHWPWNVVVIVPISHQPVGFVRNMWYWSSNLRHWPLWT